jgi:hypothetical protein
MFQRNVLPLLKSEEHAEQAARRLLAACLLFTLKIKAVLSSKTLVNFYEATSEPRKHHSS